VRKRSTSAIDSPKRARPGAWNDAIASCPRGGNAWAEALVQCAKASGRDVPFYRLNKVATREFSIIDGQSLAVGAKLLVTDDTILFGRTSMAAVEVLEDAGFKVTGLVFPVEIGLEGRRKWDGRGYSVISVFNNEFVQSLLKDGE
jgi:orotate phosphoribosyltransferase